jgi:transcriptional regulator with XRE-family HTH domain
VRILSYFLGEVFVVVTADFGARLKELREAAGLTQKQFAVQTGIALRAVTYYETGERLPTWDVVITFCQVLGVSCEAFMLPAAEREPAGPGRPPKPKDVATEEQPKLSRGRPRKQPVAMTPAEPPRQAAVVSHQPPAEDEPPKKARGRPKKQIEPATAVPKKPSKRKPKGG